MDGGCVHHFLLNPLIECWIFLDTASLSFPGENSDVFLQSIYLAHQLEQVLLQVVNPGVLAR